MSFAAVIVAAGSGSRAGAGPPKVLRLLDTKPVLRWSVEAFLTAGAAELLVVSQPQDDLEIQAALSGLQGWRRVDGGATRAQSVQQGLQALDQTATTPVLVHDAARPLVDAVTIRRVLHGLTNSQASIPVLPVVDTIKSDRDAANICTVPRDHLWRAQTPQGARLGDLVSAYRAWVGPTEPTDDAQVIEAQGGRIALVEGSPALMKLTYPEDFAMAELFLAGQARPPSRMETRTGSGIDAHRWGPGQSVWLCGIEILHPQTLIGHSDADAGLHALTDALLGALAKGDIGDHFPPSDPRWRGASSDLFLRHANDLLRGRGGRLINADVTLICEQPRIKPHRQAMRQRLADILEVSLERISVKATTTEGMGFTGRGEGLLAHATVSIELPV